MGVLTWPHVGAWDALGGKGLCCSREAEEGENIEGGIHHASVGNKTSVVLLFLEQSIIISFHNWGNNPVEAVGLLCLEGIRTE